MLKKLLAQHLDWKSVEQVRNPLIIVCRILNLFRSIDLARTFRCKSQVGDTTYVLTQIKNQRKPQWEALLKIQCQTTICPVTLMNQYVKMTALHVPSGSQLLRQQKPPYAPICNNTVGSITRSLLQSLGPHSTRGAGVQMYKKFGLTSEEV